MIEIARKGRALKTQKTNYETRGITRRGKVLRASKRC
jgi:hypothetical protein